MTAINPPAVGEFVYCSVFANTEEAGNATIVMRFDAWPSSEILQSIAKAATVEESTFVMMTENQINIRWFGRATEVPLCGHGALAVSALFSNLFSQNHFQQVHNLHDRLWLGHDRGLPAISLKSIDLMALPTHTVTIGIEPMHVFDAGRDFLIVLKDEQQLRAYQPDWPTLCKLSKIGCILCAPSSTVTATFRFFAPRAGIHEDKGSASVIPALIAYWGSSKQKNYDFVQCSGNDIRMHGRKLGNRIIVAAKVFELDRGKFTLTPDFHAL